MSEASTKVTPKKKTPSRLLNEQQKAEAIALWRAGATTLDELAKKFKKNRSTFLRLFNKEGIMRGESAVATAQKVAEKVEETITTDAAEYARRIIETKEEQYKMAAGIAKLTWASIATAKKNGVPMASIQGDLKSLHIAAQTLKLTREERYALLGIDAGDSDERPLPDLVVQELTAEDIKEMHKASMVQDDEGAFDMELGDESLIAVEDEEEKVETE